MEKVFINRERELLQAAWNAITADIRNMVPLAVEVLASVMSVGKIARSYEQKMQNVSIEIYA